MTPFAFAVLDIIFSVVFSACFQVNVNIRSTLENR